ncbi:GNAT family N-acetyltransferase [Actinosynnema sp.]|uniref:GNAT family N-acetyltransferase n=1 Tax=Actinosynnema sp. TaxID=1872144 RepID=UPI003F848437
MATPVIRPAHPEDLPALAALRWHWTLESRGAHPSSPQEAFTTHFTAWAQDHAQSHHCLVLLRDDRIIGMAWLALVPRVPHPFAPDRASGDLQCVYVTPEERNTGLGGELVTAALRLASELNLERVTVHSSDRAVPACTRSGFTLHPNLLQAVPAP